MIARVAVFLPLEQVFDYLVPPGLIAKIGVGARVWAPLGGRALEGVVLALDPGAPMEGALRPLARLLDAPPIAPELLSLGLWMAEYYMAPIGEVMRLFLPAFGRVKSRRTVALTEEGRALFAALGGALEPPAAAELDTKSRSLLGRLTEGESTPEELERTMTGAVAALRRLCERGLVRTDEQIRMRTPAVEVVLRPARALSEEERKRAPRRAEVYDRIAASGALTQAALRRADARATAHARALVESGALAEERREIVRADVAGVLAVEPSPPTLTAAQAAAVATIEVALSERRYAPYVLHGVTGSGKTEVYLRAIAIARASGRTALVLVPEISLTPQLAARFRGRFGDEVALLHSGLSDGERQDAWRRIARRQVSIVVGARSAVFAPLDNLGVVVVDEEHDSSFKQEEGVRYHGRDVALRRARAAGALALLGSATPSLEAIEAARTSRLGLIELPERATARPLPPVQVIDLRAHLLPAGNLLSAPLAQALAETLAAGEQAILFLNRRGFSTFLLCKSCGQSVRCAHCSVSLTYHRGRNCVVCHYCGFATPPPDRCACGARQIERLGYGTEQLEAHVKERFIGARVGRLDRDTAQGRGLTRVLDGLRSGDLDVVVGTQMITKGHDFPNVTLVGVVLADGQMGLPDFRAAERTFQLLEQVAGRAGRGERPGRVLIQTYHPEHPAVECARDHAYGRFAASELEARRELGFPPASRLACIRFTAADPEEVRRAAELGAQAARAAAKRAPVEERAEVLGPAEAPLGRLKGRTRWQLFCKSRSARALRVVTRAAAAVPLPRGVRVSVDIDPISML